MGILMYTTYRDWSSTLHWNLAVFSVVLSVLVGYIARLFTRDVSVDISQAILAHKIRKAKDFEEICSIFGYIHEEHAVTTEDGYVLLLHRVTSKKNAASPQPGVRKKPVVFINHGLLTNSELYMTVVDSRKCLPLVLVDSGYDVWMGNNRGNKYSRKHSKKSANTPEFWDFSFDEFARYDMPNSIDFVLKHTASKNLSYIGFSQGTAQAFAALSIYPELNDKIKVFVGLAPIMHPMGYASSFIDSFVRRYPSIIFQLFGRKSMFPSVAFWQSVLPTFILHFAMDFALVYLLAFRNHNITKMQKVASYTHIYCSSSVKSVVHWTQIMRHSTFGMYQSEGATAITKYPTHDIKTPMVLIYGDQDSLFNEDSMLQHLPSNVTCQKLEGYEHIDLLWGDKVDIDVIPKVLMTLSKVDLLL